MKKYAMLFISAFLLFTPVISSKCEAVQWMTNYEEAASIARQQDKPMILFFTGTGWCMWCNKLESEALSTRDFDQDTASKFVFVKVDFPQNEPRNSPQLQQKRELQNRFDVRGYPTIVVLDSKGQKIGSTGYRAGGGKAFANHLLKIADDRGAFSPGTNY